MDVALLFLLVFGLAETFVGYRIFRVLIVVAGLLLGWAYGPMLLGAAVAGDPAPTAAVIAAIVGALVAGLLAWFAFRVLVALFGFGVGWSLGLALFASTLAALVLAVVAAIVAFAATRPVLIGLTALNGAWVTVGAVLAMLGRRAEVPPILFLQPPDLPLDRPVWLGLVIALAAVGAVAQARQGAATVGGRTRRRARRD